MGSYAIEVSELQISNLQASGDLHVALRTGGKEMRSRALEASCGNLLSFDGMFSLSLKRYDNSGTCNLVVVDRDSVSPDVLCHVEIPSSEVLRMALDERGEYFNLKLTLGANKARGATTKGQPGGVAAVGDDAAPYVAMRIRDVTGRSR